MLVTTKLRKYRPYSSCNNLQRLERCSWLLITAKTAIGQEIARIAQLVER